MALLGLHPALGNPARSLAHVSTPATLNGQELELFRVGDYGKKGKYSHEDMEGIVSRYSAVGEAPLAIGHPEKDSEPAFGWLKSVRYDRSTGVLHGVTGDVHQTLDDGYRQKQYRNRSIGFSRDPKGQLYIHHVAFLGAVPPVVQGLKDAKFSSDPYEEVVFADDGGSMADDQLDQKIEAGFKKFFSDLFGGKKQESTQVDIDARLAELKTQFSAEIAAERQKREQVVTEFSTFKQQAQTGTAQQRAEQAVAKLKQDGRWIPAYDKCGLPELFASLAASDATITFSDAGNKEQKPTLLDALTGVLSTVGAVVPRGQIFSAEQGKAAQGATVEANGAQVDASSATFSAMVTEHAQKNSISYNAAYDQLSAQGKRPVSGSTAAGAV